MSLGGAFHLFDANPNRQTFASYIAKLPEIQVAQWRALKVSVLFTLLHFVTLYSWSNHNHLHFMMAQSIDFSQIRNGTGRKSFYHLNFTHQRIEFSP